MGAAALGLVGSLGAAAWLTVSSSATASTPSAWSSPPTTAAPSGPAAGAGQPLSVSIAPGTLGAAPATESLALSDDAVFGTSPFLGEASPITVVDARGTLVGWHATVSLQDLPGLPRDDLGRAELCVVPGVPTRVSGNPADIVRGDDRSCAGVGQPLAVFWAAPGGGGGTYRDAAALAVIVPGGDLPHRLVATVAVSVH
jgi:hypothetical protein